MKLDSLKLFLNKKCNVLVLIQYQHIASLDIIINIFTLKPVLRAIKQFSSGFIFQECESDEKVQRF